MSDTGSTREDSRRIVIGVLALFVGGLGVHRFMLGDTKGGVIRLVLSIVTFGLAAWIGFIEGIIYLIKTDQEFYDTYVVGRKAWF